MAQKVASLYAEIGADTSGLKRGLDESKTGLDGIMTKLAGVAVPAAAAMAAFNLVGDAIKFSTAAAMDAEVETTRMNAILEATGGAAGMTANELEGLATNLSNVSGVEDEVILRGESVLLTFRSIGEDIFPQATEAALDMSMAMGMDLQSSILMVGKALNEPIQGIGALRRVGVQLTDDQEAQIKSFMAINDVASAQGVILEELALEFGGVSEAMGDTAQGRADRMRVALGNLGETVGGPFADAVYRGATVMFNLLDGGEAVTVMMEEQEQQARDTAMAYEEYADAQTELLVSEMQITQGRADEINLMIEQEAWLTQMENTYGELDQAMIINLVTTHAITEEQGDLLTELIGLRPAFEAQITDVGLLTRSMYEYSDALEEAIPGDVEIRDRHREHAQSAREAADETGNLIGEIIDLDQAMKDLDTVVGGSLGPTIEDYNQSQADLQTEMLGVQTRIDEIIAAGDRWVVNAETGATTRRGLTRAEKDELAGLQDEYGGLEQQYTDNATAHEEATRRILFDLLTQRAALDGLTSAELGLLTHVAESWGLVDSATATAALGFDNAIGLLEEGNVSGAYAAVDGIGEHFSDTGIESEDAITSLVTGPMAAMEAELRDINGLVQDVAGDYGINFNVSVTGDPIPAVNNGSTNIYTGPAPVGYSAAANDFTVPTGYEDDSYVMAFSSGEHVTVNKPGETPSGGGDTYYVTLNVGGGSNGYEVYQQFKAAMDDDLRARARGGVQTSDY